MEIKKFGPYQPKSCPLVQVVVKDAARFAHRGAERWSGFAIGKNLTHFFAFIVRFSPHRIPRPGPKRV